MTSPVAAGGDGERRTETFVGAAATDGTLLRARSSPAPVRRAPRTRRPPARRPPERRARRIDNPTAGRAGRRRRCALAPYGCLLATRRPWGRDGAPPARSSVSRVQRRSRRPVPGHHHDDVGRRGDSRPTLGRVWRRRGRGQERESSPGLCASPPRPRGHGDASTPRSPLSP